MISRLLVEAKDLEKFITYDCTEKTVSSLDLLIAKLRSASAEIKSNGTIPQAALGDLVKEVQSSADDIISVNKETFDRVSALGRSIDNCFKDVPHALDVPLKAGDGQEKCFSLAICRHLMRERNTEIADELAKSLNVPDNDMEQDAESYEGMKYISDQIKILNLAPANEWVEKHLATIKRQDDAFHYDMMKLQYIKTVSEIKKAKQLGRDVSEQLESAISFVQKNMASFYPTKLQDLRRMLCALLYIGSDSIAKQNPFFSDDETPDAAVLLELADTTAQRFERMYCSVNGSCPDLPLRVMYTAGVAALPVIIRSLWHLKRLRDWTEEAELHVEVPMLPAHRFHTVYACPVMRSQATRENPPMLLPCGHVISQSALANLAKPPQSDFRCPYCPLEASKSQAIPLHF